MVAKLDERVNTLEKEFNEVKSDVKVNTIFIKDMKKILIAIFATLFLTLASTVIMNVYSNQAIERKLDSIIEKQK